MASELQNEPRIYEVVNAEHRAIPALQGSTRFYIAFMTPAEAGKTDYFGLPQDPTDITPESYRYVRPTHVDERKAKEEKVPTEKAIELIVTPVGDGSYSDYVSDAQKRNLTDQERENTTRRLHYPPTNP